MKVKSKWAYKVNATLYAPRFCRVAMASRVLSTVSEIILSRLLVRRKFIWLKKSRHETTSWGMSNKNKISRCQMMPIFTKINRYLHSPPKYPKTPSPFMISNFLIGRWKIKDDNLIKMDNKSYSISKAKAIKMNRSYPGSRIHPNNNMVNFKEY